MTSIIEFVKTGKLGSISLDVTKNNVEKFLGKPDDVSISRKPTILKYGALQLAFYKESILKDEILNSIHLYFDDDKITFPDALKLEGWIPSQKTDQMEFLELLRSNNVEAIEDIQHTFKNLQVGYKSVANVVIVFNVEANQDKLVSIHLTRR